MARIRPLSIVAVAGSAVVVAALLGSGTTARATGLVEAVRSAGASSDVSANWSGYAATAAGTTFSDVTGTWQIPTATCTLGQSSSAAIWVGLGGYNIGSQALEQAGTSSDCTETGKPSYYIWYELVPATSVNVKLKVAAHDTVTSSVVVSGTSVLVQVKDRTRRTTFTKRLTMPTPDVSSAEWIAEAPSECGEYGHCAVVQLTNFGSVTFSNVAATGNATGGTLSSNPGWTIDQIQLVPQTHHFLGEPETGSGSTGAGAMPTAPSTDGRSFTVNYDATPTATST